MAGGVVVYSNEAKIALAGIDPALIEEHGAVSEQVGARWPWGCARGWSVDVGVGVTGVAGPGGGTELKPVGLGVAERRGTRRGLRSRAR